MTEHDALQALRVIAKMRNGIVGPLMNITDTGRDLIGLCVVPRASSGYVGGDFRLHYWMPGADVTYGPLRVLRIRADYVELDKYGAGGRPL